MPLWKKKVKKKHACKERNKYILINIYDLKIRYQSHEPTPDFYAGLPLKQVCLKMETRVQTGILESLDSSSQPASRSISCFMTCKCELGLNPDRAALVQAEGSAWREGEKNSFCPRIPADR